VYAQTGTITLLVFLGFVGLRADVPGEYWSVDAFLRAVALFVDKTSLNRLSVHGHLDREDTFLVGTSLSFGAGCDCSRGRGDRLGKLDCDRRSEGLDILVDTPQGGLMDG
jgi:hypothetical protein